MRAHKNAHLNEHDSPFDAFAREANGTRYSSGGKPNAIIAPTQQCDDRKGRNNHKCLSNDLASEELQIAERDIEEHNTIDDRADESAGEYGEYKPTPL